jgi:hypothetical protein
MMATTQIRKAPRSRAAEERAGASGNGKNLGRRLGLRLWTLLHAQALLNGNTEAERYGPR